MERKVFTAEEKTKILREHLENQVSLSELSEKYHVNINSMYNWKKQLFEGAVDIFSGKPQKTSQKDQEKIDRMEKELQRKTNITTHTLLQWLGVRKGKYYRWERRLGTPNKHNGNIPRKTWLLDWEREAITSYYEKHREEDYRRLT